MHVFKKFLYNIYSRVVIFLFIRGIFLPGFRHVKKHMGSSLYQKIERQKLIHDMKGERFHLRVGPLWLRNFMEKIFLNVQKNKFLILIFLKVALSLFLISLPVALFILQRGVLPVPERVPYEIPSTHLKPTSYLHVDFPYTEEPFLQNSLPEGLKNFGIGFFPVKWTVSRGFLVSDEKELLVYRNEMGREAMDGFEAMDEVPRNDNILRIGYYLYPSANSKHISCVLEIFNEHNELLAQTTELTPRIESYSKYSIRNSWRKAFTPNIIPSYGFIGELKIPVNVPPEKIVVKSSEIMDGVPRDPEASRCTFLVSDFSFEHSTPKPLPRRGVIFIVADSLRANTAYDSHLMPKLNGTMKNGGVTFLEHRAQSNESFLSMLSLFTSRYPSEFKDTKPSATLPLALQNLGYRVGAIGSVSKFTNAVWNGTEMGIHNAIVAEQTRYEGRHITELAGQWLEKYGEAPFFLYLHYNTMDTPYKPPFANLVVSKLIQNPFGLNQKQQLYRGVARYFDSELDLLFKKLKDLGIYENVDIILTSNHGVQMDKKDWSVLSSEKDLKGAYASKEHTMYDEEIRVPLMMKIAGSHFPKKMKVSEPSAHLDLFPTLYGFMGGDSENLHVRGLDFSSSFFSQNTKKTFADIFSQRHYLRFEAQKYSGIMAWNINNVSRPTKYIRQLAPDGVMLYLTKAPWQKEIEWYVPETYSTMDFNTHLESWRKNLPADTLKTMRNLYETSERN